MSHLSRQHNASLVVFAILGIAPIYVLHAIFGGVVGAVNYSLPPTLENIVGVLSLILWSLFLIAAIKYMLFMAQSYHKREARGYIPLLSLFAEDLKSRPRLKKWTWVVLAGMACFYVNSMIMPGLALVTTAESIALAKPELLPYTVPLALVFLGIATLFFSSGAVPSEKLTLPLVLVWFFTLAGLGGVELLHAPAVMRALDPCHALYFLVQNPQKGSIALGMAVLASAGIDFVYAHMHANNKKRLQIVWFSLVLPALLLSYLGQGALLLNNPQAIAQPFYVLAPNWARYPLIALALLLALMTIRIALATASTTTAQAVHLGVLPRMNIRYNLSGAPDLPWVKWAFIGGVSFAILSFRSTYNLAQAYSIGFVTSSLLMALLLFAMIHYQWRKFLMLSTLCAIFLLLIDLAFFAAALRYFIWASWFLLLIGSTILLLMTTWQKGRGLLQRHALNLEVPALADFVDNVIDNVVPTVPGTAVFLTSTPDKTPQALLHALKHFKCLHERIVVVAVKTMGIPCVPDTERVEVQRLRGNFWQVVVHYGFDDQQNIPLALRSCAEVGLGVDIMSSSFFLGHATLIAGTSTELSGLSLWRSKLFAALFRNADYAAAYFHLPPNRVIELGSQITL